MPRFFRSGKCLGVLAALLLAAPVANAGIMDLVEIPALNKMNEAEALLGDSVAVADPPLPEWQSKLIDEIVNLTWDYAAGLDPNDNETVQQQKLEAYLGQIMLTLAGGLPKGWCLHFHKGSGLEPGIGSYWSPAAWVVLPEVALGQYIFYRDPSGNWLC